MPARKTVPIEAHLSPSDYDSIERVAVGWRKYAKVRLHHTGRKRLHGGDKREFFWYALSGFRVSGAKCKFNFEDDEIEFPLHPQWLRGKSKTICALELEKILDRFRAHGAHLEYNQEELFAALWRGAAGG